MIGSPLETCDTLVRRGLVNNTCGLWTVGIRRLIWHKYDNLVHVAFIFLFVSGISIIIKIALSQLNPAPVYSSLCISFYDLVYVFETHIFLFFKDS